MELVGGPVIEVVDHGILRLSNFEIFDSQSWKFFYKHFSEENEKKIAKIRRFWG